ncbi:hypothetical protein I79_010418 [Cricetulus griseus]|uniref:Uncharacterized protein n=1 Tax=Cricetulus griseus TaxID=10029 RepID=G3HIF7_CRIGR|nr:hypothetical protein I79_010418 [Cricetulus griseus]
MSHHTSGSAVSRQYLFTSTNHAKTVALDSLASGAVRCKSQQFITTGHRYFATVAKSSVRVSAVL